MEKLYDIKLTDIKTHVKPGDCWTFSADFTVKPVNGTNNPEFELSFRMDAYKHNDTQVYCSPEFLGTREEVADFFEIKECHLSRKTHDMFDAFQEIGQRLFDDTTIKDCPKILDGTSERLDALCIQLLSEYKGKIIEVVETTRKNASLFINTSDDQKVKKLEQAIKKTENKNERYIQI